MRRLINMPRHRRLGLTIVGIGMAVAASLLAAAPPHAEGTGAHPAERWRKAFARPDAVPGSKTNPPSIQKIELGRRLFFEPALSANGKISCATCHVPELGFADGVERSQAGVTGRQLRRHTPTLWNLAWSPLLFWDGRTSSLEEQARFPMSDPDEMASSPEAAALRLAASPDYQALFKAAFVGETTITGTQVLAALAAYERTLISPPTRFDKWIAGDANALTSAEIRGFQLFTGRAGCINCHSGFAFTDQSFHDIGLPGDDRGRGPVAEIGVTNYAFKTPSLRELAWTSPYMHDGSIATLEDVIRYYEAGGIDRPSRSPDMPKPFTLKDDERSDLVVFLEALSSENPPKPSTEAWAEHPGTTPDHADPAVVSTSISQRDKTFRPGSIRVTKGATVTVLNDDTRTHNVRIVDPRMNVNSGAQEPGESVHIKFDQTGHFEAHCAIHPTMRLSIDVE